MFFEQDLYILQVAWKISDIIYYYMELNCLYKHRMILKGTSGI